MAGRWIMFGLVMAWRFAKAYPIVVVALVALYLAGAGLVALADASGLGISLFLLIAVAIVVALVVVEARPKARAEHRARAREQERISDRHALFVAWERGTIPPAEALAQIQARNPSGSDGGYVKQERVILAEAQEAIATGTAAKRDARVQAYRERWEGMGVAVSDTEFDWSHGEMVNSFYMPEKFRGHNGPVAPPTQRRTSDGERVAYVRQREQEIQELRRRWRDGEVEPSELRRLLRVRWAAGGMNSMAEAGLDTEAEKAGGVLPEPST
jgi:Ni/Co efflux regulator RcnB